jgi:hypothetical protein
MQTLSNDKILELLANLVGTYLADNGGYSNRYDTYVRGTIIPNKLGGITEFRTPGNKTKAHIESLANGLEKEIKKLLHVYDIETVVALDAEYLGDGCYLQKVSVLQSKIVEVPQAKITPTPPVVIVDEEAEELKRKKKQQEIDAENKRKKDEEDDLKRRQRQQDDETAMLASVSAMIACM